MYWIVIALDYIYSPWFSASNGTIRLRPKMMPLQRAPQEGHNGTSFSSVAASSEELYMTHECEYKSYR